MGDDIMNQKKKIDRLMNYIRNSQNFKEKNAIWFAMNFYTEDQCQYVNIISQLIRLHTFVPDAAEQSNVSIQNIVYVVDRHYSGMGL